MYKNIYKIIHKIVLGAIVALFLASCQNSSINSASKDSKEQDFQNNNSPTKQELSNNELKNQSPYETINSESQAESVNQQNTNQELEIDVQDRVFFLSNSSTINDEAKKILDVQADWLKSDQSIKIIIEGHCDERGSREYNIALGEKRAFAVKKYLKQKGVQESRMKTTSYGKERPAFFGDSDEIHAKNRRAVAVVSVVE